MLVGGLLLGPACLPTAVAAPGRVIGHLDSVAYDGKQEFISGWACQQGQKESIPIHIYANPTPGDPTKANFSALATPFTTRMPCTKSLLSSRYPNGSANHEQFINVV